MSAGKNMFEMLWERMDECVSEFYKGVLGDDPEWSGEKKFICVGEMRGLAFAIKSFSAPFLQEEHAVAKHARARWQAIQMNAQIPDTPGVGGFNPLPPGAVKARASATAKPTVSPETEKQIRAGLAAGFPAKDLASLYKVDIKVVETMR